VSVLRGQPPAEVTLGPVVEYLAHELDAQPGATTVGEDIDIGQICDVHVVGHDAGKPDLATIAPIETDDPRRFADRLGHGFERPAPRPIRLAAQKLVNGVQIDASAIVVELEAAR
jgi:hypothetical protein